MARQRMRYALGIEFIGTHYRGWQRQREVDSIQARLEHALGTVANHPLEVVAAGRTDAGVHASGMVAHFDSHAVRSLDNWQRGASSLLPHDIAILWITPVPDDFHARFGCVARRYCYVTQVCKHRPAILRHQVHFLRQMPNLTRMQKACDMLIGTHDFSSFRAALCQAKSPIRTMIHAKLHTRGDFFWLDIKANGFLHHMVRNIMGALYAVGDGRMTLDDFRHRFLSCDRTQMPPTAPADGLYFVQADYPHGLPKTPLYPAWLRAMASNQTLT